MTTSTTSTTTPRSAHATIRGYWWQFVVACLHWLDLDENEYLVCEGVEDVDLYYPARVDGEQPVALYEQLKDYQSQNISLGSKAGREILANFVSRYVEDICHTGKPRPTFRLVTTAKRADQSGDVDVIDLWQARASGDEPSDVFLGGIRIALSGAKKDLCAGQKSTPARAQRVQDALDWLDEEDDNTRWIGFLDSVEWCFEAPDLSASHDKLVEELQSKVEPSLAGLVAERLLVELITNVSLAGGGNQRFDKPRLEEILSATRQDLEQWAEEQAPSLAFMRNLLTLTLEETQATREQLVALSKVVDQNNALLKLLVDRGLLEAAPFGLTSATPVWDELKLHTRAAINTQPRVRINRHSPLPRATLRRLEEELVGGDEQRLFILEGAGGSGKSTALVTCARHLLEDPDSVVLLLNLDHITAGTPLGALVPNTPRRSPDRLLLDALEETGRSRGVLIIDQLDRLSQVSASSGAKRDYFDQIKQLIMRTIEHEQLRVLVACREFDRKSDSRMKPLVEHAQSKTLALGPLEDEDVRRVVEELGYTSALTRGQLDILAIPLHLHLLAGLDRRDRAEGVPLDEYHLYERFWDDKRRALRPVLDSKWSQLHKQICNLFLTSKRRYITEREIEDDLADIEKLVSEDIFRRTEDGFVYFHQRYEEYVFARYFEGDLLGYILDEEQSFLAVDQAKAILIARRQQRTLHERYAQDLRAIIFGNNVRSHYKWLVRGLLSTQTDLLDVEFDVWLEMLTSDDTVIAGEALHALNVNPSFIQKLEQHDLFEECFVEGSCKGHEFVGDMRDRYQNVMLGLLLNHDPEKGAWWVRQLLQDEQHVPLVERMFQTDPCFEHRVLFDVFLEAIRAGLWNHEPRHLNPTNVYRLPKDNVAWVPEVSVVCIRNNLARIDTNAAMESGDYKVWNACVERVFATLVDKMVLPDLVNKAPCAVIEHYTQVLDEIMTRLTLPDQTSAVWRWVGRTSYPDDSEAWLGSLFAALDACQDPDALVRAACVGSAMLSTNSSARMVRWRLLSMGNVSHIRAAIQEFTALIDAKESLMLPDRYTTTARVLVKAFEQLGETEWSRFIDKLLSHDPQHAARDHQLFPLLSVLPEEALTIAALNELKSFRERIHASVAQLEPQKTRGGWIDPIDSVDFDAMPENELVDYMCNANPQPTGPFHNPDKGRTLSVAASEAPERFVEILSTRFDEIPSDVKSALVVGWNDALQAKNGQAPHEFSEEGWAQIFDLLVRIYSESPNESARNISFLLKKYPHVPSDDITKLVVEAMLTHLNPQGETWNNAQELFRGTINCVRGRMAEILGEWVRQSREVFEQTREAIASACQDPITQVRAGVALPVLMSSSYDPNFAIDQFLALTEDQPDELLATPYILDCLRYMMHRYLDRLTPVIERMLASEVEDVRVAGGKAFGLSTFADASRLARVAILYDDEAIAQGIGEVWKSKLQQLSDEQCQALIILFDHPSEDVLSKLTGLFRDTEVEWFLEHRHLLDAYFDAQIARVRTAQVFFAFKDWNLVENQPEIALEYIERTFGLHQQLEDAGESTASIDTHGMCRMLDELYKQHPRERERVIELLDAMVKAGIWPAERTLREVQSYRD